MIRAAFPIKDLLRRKLQTTLVILNLTVCVAMTVTFILLGENLGAELSLVASEKLTKGFSLILSQFVFLIVLLNSLAGILVTSFLVSIITSERIRDIGIMKAAGCLTDRLIAYFSDELLLITLVGCSFGTILGVIINYASVWFLNMVGVHIQPKEINLCAHIKLMWHGSFSMFVRVLIAMVAALLALSSSLVFLRKLYCAQ